MTDQKFNEAQMYQNLELWMTENRLSLKQLAKVAGCSVSSVSRWINQEDQFSGRAIKRIRDTYRLTPNQVDAFFFGGVLEEEPNIRHELYLEVLQEVTAAVTASITKRGQRT